MLILSEYFLHHHETKLSYVSKINAKGGLVIYTSRIRFITDILTWEGRCSLTPQSY